MTQQQYPFSQASSDAVDGSAAPPGQVRLLKNCRLEKGGRIVRTPAWASSWRTNESGTELGENERAIAIHGNAMAYQNYVYAQFRQLNAEGRWDALIGSDLNARRVVTCEAPRAMDLPVTRHTHEGGCQIATTDVAGLYVLLTTEYDGADSGDFYVTRQMFTLVDGQPIAHGPPARVSTGTYRPYTKTVGPYICYTTSTVGYRIEWFAGGAWHSLTGGHTIAGRFDVAYTDGDTKLVFVSSDGYTSEFDPAGPTWSAWTSRAAAFTGPVAGTYSVVTQGAYVWIACRVAGADYHAATWTYATWAVKTAATAISLAATSYGIPELSRVGTYSGHEYVWLAGQVTTNASSASYGSLLLAGISETLTIRSDIVLADCAIGSTIKSHGFAYGSWGCVTSLRKYLRQCWLVWLDTVAWAASDDTVPLGATFVWRGRLFHENPGDNERPASLLSGQLSSDQLGTRSGLIWGGVVVVDGNADIDATYPRTAPAVATVYGFSGNNAGATWADWAWEPDDATARVPELLGTCDAQGAALFSAGLPVSMAAKLDCAGAQEQPPTPVLEEDTTGTLTNGTYRFRVAYRWSDSAGRVHMSPVSEEASITTVGGHPVIVTIAGLMRIPGAVDMAIQVYRTEAGGSVFYQSNPYDIGYPWLASEDTPMEHLSSVSDADLITRRMLYTQGSADAGNAAALNGRLECWGPPPCRSIAAGTQRVVCGGLEQTQRVRFSNIFFPAEAPSFPESPAFWIDLPDTVVAVGALDDTYVAFGRSGVWVITGAGPDIQGNGEFDAPRQVAGAPGCLTARSVVHAPEGVYWQGVDLQVWRLLRGSLQPESVSAAFGDLTWAPLHSGLDYGIADSPELRPSHIVGAVRDDTSGLLYFARRGSPNASNLSMTGQTLVFDAGTGAWSAESDTGTLAFGTGSYLRNGVCHPVVFTWLASGQSMPEDGYAALSPLPKDASANRFAAYNSGFGHDMIVDLGNVAPWETGGHGFVRRIGVLASDEATPAASVGSDLHWAGLQFWFRYDGDQVDSGVSAQNVTPAVSQSNVGRWMFRAAPARMRCSELAPVIRLNNSVTGNDDAEVWLHALIIDADPVAPTRVRRRAGTERAAS